MTKSADYGISHKRFKSGTKQIWQLLVHEFSGESCREGTTWTRQNVITAIEVHKKTFVTIRKRDGKWVRGAHVNVIKIENVKYLRTDSNNTKKDNLDELPDF